MKLINSISTCYIFNQRALDKSGKKLKKLI
jgi:hypothetical protein